MIDEIVLSFWKICFSISTFSYIISSPLNVSFWIFLVFNSLMLRERSWMLHSNQHKIEKKLWLNFIFRIVIIEKKILAVKFKLEWFQLLLITPKVDDKVKRMKRRTFELWIVISMPWKKFWKLYIFQCEQKIVRLKTLDNCSLI